MPYCNIYHIRFHKLNFSTLVMNLLDTTALETIQKHVRHTMRKIMIYRSSKSDKTLLKNPPTRGEDEICQQNEYFTWAPPKYVQKRCAVMHRHPTSLLCTTWRLLRGSRRAMKGPTACFHQPGSTGSSARV